MSELRNSLIYRATKNLLEYRRLRRANPAILTDVSEQHFPAYVINLARSSERREYITSHLKSIGITPTLFNAVDGKQLSMDELLSSGKYNDEVSRKTFDRSLSMAEIGCGLSHIYVYESIVRQQAAFALVSEDDAQFSPDARARIQRIIETAPPDWELIQLRFDCRDFDIVSSELVDFRFNNDLPVAATAYLIKLSAATKIIANAYPIRLPADSLLGRANQWGIRIYGAWPELVGVNNVFPSAIQGNRNWRFKLSNLVKEIILKLVR
jgi:glycosyl transferase family 25